MGTRYVYHLGDMSSDFERTLANKTFPTKRDTAEDYPFYIYVPETTTWLAPRNANAEYWDDILMAMER